jgi:gamma-glutamyltranspeptidase/glutathione hydrolase
MLNKEQAAYALYPPMDAGMKLRNSDLAAVLRDIGRHGFNTFYRGELGAAIAAAIQKRGGFVTARDMATHHSDWVQPLRGEYRDLTVLELPPPTQGMAALAMLRELDRGWGDDFIGAFTSARNVAYEIRDRTISDPDFAMPEGGDTVYLCCADEHGNLVSLIQSVSFDFGSGIVAEGTGILLQNRGCYFSLDPAHVNRLEPKKRTMHTLIPALALRDGGPWALFGSMGGDAQPQFQAQVLINLVDHGLEPQEALARPRLRVRSRGRLDLEADYPGAAELARSDPNVVLMPARHHEFGHAHAIVIDGPNAWRAGADPRSDGSVETAP